MAAVTSRSQVQRSPLSDTKRKIMKTAAELFAGEGYGSVGTSQISEATGYGKGALYYHIRSKGDLLYDIMTIYLEDLLSEARQILAEKRHVKERVYALSESILRAVVEDKAEMTVCFREVHALEDTRRRSVLRLHGAYLGIWRQVTDDAAREGDFRPLDNDELKALMGMYFYSFLWIGNDRTADIPALAAKFSGIIMRACHA
ncbi:TetR/AcrR family transcriptional regulator [Jiella sonneratiae]|uniref:TetR family transcriptional regulator n=1 Tax=Jiella sonneratiae TaxID=2816856 RepID=A0ABS3J5M1_9HYPH|nr:TetR/AcrR family transcriptional regulator [Jiella sonneratiae]MBO0904253.1 TetR family transcriptional regulator [Jiella sonneratiae]